MTVVGRASPVSVQADLAPVHVITSTVAERLGELA